MSVPIIKTADGNAIPQVGLGLWQVKDDQQFLDGFKAALKAGYRHFDSAQAYGNEHLLGKAWQASKLKREDIFITTKIDIRNFSPSKLLFSFDESLESLDTTYVDLLLLHFPVTFKRKAAWQALEGIKANGLAKSIGVSNYTIRHLEQMAEYAKEMPVVNQVELHVFLQQPELIEYCHKNNIAVEAYSPLAHAKAMDNEAIKSIALKHNKSYAQIMLRWAVEQSVVVLPKSINPDRIKENIDIFDFKLDKDDLSLLKSQDKDMRTCWSPVHVP